MDFIVGLPNTSRHHDSIWVIVDRLTKTAHFLPIHTTHRAEKYAEIYCWGPSASEGPQKHNLTMFSK